MHYKLIIWTFILSTSLFVFGNAKGEYISGNQNICNEFYDLVDYNNDNQFNFDDINLITSVIEEISFDCRSGRVCDFISTDDGQYTSADIGFLIHVLQFGEFPEVDEILYTLEDFCPTEPNSAPYDVSLDPCFLTKLDYNNDQVVDVTDWRWVYNQVWNGPLACPEGKICSFEYGQVCDDSYSIGDSISLGYFMLGHTSLEDFREHLADCHDLSCAPVEPTCADYDAFDYNNDGRVDRDDGRYLFQGRRFGHDSCEGGTWYDSDRADAQFCCPAGKVCDIRCASNGVSNEEITYPDYLLFNNAFRFGNLPSTICESNGREVCEESQYQTEYIRWFGVRYFIGGNLYTSDEIIKEAMSKAPSYLKKVRHSTIKEHASRSTK